MAIKAAAKAKAKASAAPGKKSAASAKQAAPQKNASARKAPSKGPPKTHTLKTIFEQLADGHEISRKQAQAMANGMVDLMTTLLKNGDRVRITGLGILEVKDRPARTGRNPATGAAIQIAASKKVAFRVAKELKETV